MQCFSIVHGYADPLEILSKCRFRMVRVGVSLRACISNKSPVRRGTGESYDLIPPPFFLNFTLYPKLWTHQRARKSDFFPSVLSDALRFTMLFVSFLLSLRPVGVRSLHEHFQTPYVLQHVVCVKETVCSQRINAITRDEPSFLSQKDRFRAASLTFGYFAQQRRYSP